MKYLVALAVVFSIQAAKADAPISNQLAGTTMLPSVLTLYTFGIGMDRGVAYQEQLRDDIVEFENDWNAGLILDIADVRGETLKETLSELSEQGVEGDIHEIVAQISSKLQ